MYLAVLPLLVACGGGQAASDMAPAPPDMAGPMMVGEYGTVVDYFTKMPQVGFTVTDGTETTTTDANGRFVLPAPMGAKLALMITGPSYTHLYLTEMIAVDPGVDRGEIPAPSISSFGLGQQVMGSDPTKAVVYITLVRTGACTSLAGGTLTLLSPAGASVAYFTSSGLPTGASMIDRSGNLPAAVVFNVPPGQDITFELNHPTCKLAAADSKLDGATLTGHVQTVAAEPDDNNSSLELVVE
jgi:hypothetical protein